MKVIYVNTYAYKGQHEVINAALLSAICEIFEEIKVYTGKLSWRILLNYIQRKDLIVRYIGVVSGKSKIANVLRYFVSAMYNLLILFISPRCCVIIYVFNNLFSLHIINWLNKLLKRNVLIV